MTPNPLLGDHPVALVVSAVSGIVAIVGAVHL
jgi:hypothetical protein